MAERDDMQYVERKHLDRIYDHLSHNDSRVGRELRIQHTLEDIYYNPENAEEVLLTAKAIFNTQFNRSDYVPEVYSPQGKMAIKSVLSEPFISNVEGGRLVVELYEGVWNSSASSFSVLRNEHLPQSPSTNGLGAFRIRNVTKRNVSIQ